MTAIADMRHLASSEKKAIGRRLRSIRKTHDVTGEGFAKAVGTSQASLSGYETGRNAVPIRIVVCVCEIYEVNADWLLMGRGRMLRFVRKAEAA